MNIESTSKVISKVSPDNKAQNTSSQSSAEFKQELKKLNISNTEDEKTQEKNNKNTDSINSKTDATEELNNNAGDKEAKLKVSDTPGKQDVNTENTVEQENSPNINTGFDINNPDTSFQEESTNFEVMLNGLQSAVDEVSQIKKDGIVVQKYDMFEDGFKKEEQSPDKTNKQEVNTVINNDINIQEPKEQIMPQMDLGMNFNSDGKPFSDFVPQNQNQLSMSEKDLKEEIEILSTMAENIAMINKNIVEQPKNTVSKTKTVSDTSGVKKVDKKTNLVVETIVKYDSIIMDKSDVDFFTKLVEGGSINMDSLRGADKSSQVSKTLADMLAKSMQDNKPVRIDFDNNISVIIRISREGKISADFLPSSQVAEAYLKENLPLLRQKFDENNIDYDELNQRKQPQDERNNRKKGRDNE